MDKYIETNKGGFVVKDYIGGQSVQNRISCPKPHPFVDGEDVKGKYKIEEQFWNETSWWPTYHLNGKVKPGTKTRTIAVPIQQQETIVEKQKSAWKEMAEELNNETQPTAGNFKNPNDYSGVFDGMKLSTATEEKKSIQESIDDFDWPGTGRMKHIVESSKDHNEETCPTCIKSREAEEKERGLTINTFPTEEKEQMTELEKQVVQLLTVTGQLYVLDAIEYIKKLQGDYDAARKALDILHKLNNEQ